MILALPWISLFGALVMIFIPKNNLRAQKWLTLACCGVSAFIVLVLTLQFDASKAGYQFLHRYEWLPALGITYQVGLDGINLTMCLLHALVSLASSFIAVSGAERRKEYLIFYLILTGALYGVFTVLDIFLLYFFYETTLIPIFPLIAIWGGKNKDYAAMKLAIFTAAGAILALVGLLGLYHYAGASSFDLIRIEEALRAKPLPLSFQTWAVPLLLLGFGAISSFWPLHSWSPIAYGAAPTAANMLHAGVKVGPYLILRLIIPFFPDGIRESSSWLAGIAAAGILYAAYVAIRQRDLKLIIGFSIVSHMGYVLLGIAGLNTVTLSGAVLLLFSHGIATACAFGLIGHLSDQTRTSDAGDYGGLSARTPFWSVAFIMVSMASLSLPGFANFASELLIFIGAWNSYPVPVSLAVFGVLLTAVYILRMVQTVCYGPVNRKWPELRDLGTLYEKFPFVLLLAALLLFGFWPQGLLKFIQPAVGGLLS